MFGMTIGMFLVWFATVSPLVASIWYKPISKNAKILWSSVAVIVPAILLVLTFFIVNLIY